MTALRSILFAAVLGSCMRVQLAHAGPGTVDSAYDEAKAALDDAYAKKAKGDLAGAARSFESARTAGAEPQLIALELGYVAAIRGNSRLARGYFQEASLGSDTRLRAHAAKELSALEPDAIELPLRAEKSSESSPKLAYLAATQDAMPSETAPFRGSFWADLYAEAYGWHRIAGSELGDDLIPTLRLRLLYRLDTLPDLNVYGVARATRDLASRDGDERGLPLIYADNQASLGIGFLMRLWDRQLGLFAQAGPTVDLVASGGPPADLDIRAGAFLGLETARCASPSRTSAWVSWPCAELYSEAIYVNRFRDNVIAFARGRAGMTYWATAPLLLQVLLEGRAAVDTNGDFYNNFFDVGALHRFRFLSPFRLDLMTGIHGGSYFGVAGDDPAPKPLGYVELRLLAATYMEL